ncbi:MAG: Nif3-like dinuclear metal center hexameric protein [Candidatus Eremiobacteraeota bacterium]|nr:Nif3-like dinuclear metal center hexameric protein [Candidatus Eremiobacteraeota bacterium]
MRVPLSEIIEYMEQIAPRSTALEWDNVGLQVGDPRSSIGSVLFALDVSPSVIEEAESLSADLIISHHPLLFRPVSRIDFSTTNGLMIRELIRHGIVLFTAHTNLDRSFMGTGKILADRIGLKKIKRYSDDPDDEMNMVVTGSFEQPLSADEVISLLKGNLKCDCIKLVGNPVNVLTVAVIPGSSSSLLRKMTLPVDLIITGELSYHEALSAQYQGRAVAIMGHFISEKPVMYYLADKFREKFTSLSIEVSERDGEPYRIV